jgi:hypothetical protein
MEYTALHPRRWNSSSTCLFLFCKIILFISFLLLFTLSYPPSFILLLYPLSLHVPTVYLSLLSTTISYCSSTVPPPVPLPHSRPTSSLHSAYSSVLKTKAPHSSKMLIMIYQITRCHILENRHLCRHCHQNPSSHTQLTASPCVFTRTSCPLPIQHMCRLLML